MENSKIVNLLIVINKIMADEGIRKLRRELKKQSYFKVKETFSS